ncbi:MAG: glycosyltransferase [Halobacteriales archaeon]|nr:glycosyltransferase [Halobacteriales archaeon]
MAAPSPLFVSVVVTVRNESKAIGALLDSLVLQEGPFEVLVVDSNSEDDTVAIAQRCAAQHPQVRVIVFGGTRGASRNEGVRQAKGEHVAFIDGDCVASPAWLRELRQGLQRAEVAAGKTQYIGFGPFEQLARVELRVRGYDVTLPSCNLAYRKRVFEQLAGFDSWFRTAEDIDLNFRAVHAGHHIESCPRAVVFAKTRSTLTGFLKQALWNGYGRKQLTLKHGNLWSQYSLRQLLRTQAPNPWALLRLGAALVGYTLAKVRERAPREPPAMVNAENPNKHGEAAGRRP